MKKLLHKTIFSIAALLLLEVIGAQAQNYFRSVATGTWSALATWQMSPDNITWGPATYAPTFNDYTVTIQSPNTVTINAAITIDETVVNSGATLANSGAIVVIFNDGPGVDLIINGTFLENATASINWTASASWLIGSFGSLIRTQNTSSNFWQLHYNGGISTIPSTANWILRKNGGANPSITTTGGAALGGAVYPNLIIENNTATMWATATSSTFQGNSAYPTIKGNFEIGGSGTNSVNFLNQHTNATPTRVQGNVIVKAGSILGNNGTGLEVQGNLTVNGTIQYDANDLRTLDFAAGAAQTITVGALGACGIWNMRMMKTANDLTLNSPVKVNNTLTFTAAGIGGRIFTTSTNLLTIEDNATTSGASNTSHVNGPVRKIGDEAFTYPVGKNGYYRMCAMGIATGASGTFWTENFTTGTGWTLANVTGPEGADPNPFYIGPWEGGGIPPGGCGVANNGNNTLHTGSVFNPTGGAAYDAGGGCGFLFCPLTNRRAQSPAINCTGYSGILLSFNYIEFGNGTLDNMTLWYYDGITWAQIADPPKTVCCGGACNGTRQGQWTNYLIALPVSANNNPNVRIGFKWENNDDGIGTDPSFAVDDISVGTSFGADSYTAEYFRANPQVVYNNVVNPPLDHISQCEYWKLDRNIGTQARTVTLSWDTPNSCGVTNLSDLRVAYFNSASWDDKGNGGTTGNTSAGTIVTSSTVNSFGPFTLASTTTQNPLPVTLLDFYATPQGNDALLTWTTTTEINNDHFEVLSSSSASSPSFEEIGQVKGIGNSTLVHRYSFLDQRPEKKGTYYYRLRQVDFDGKSSHSNIVAVNFTEGKGMTLVGVIPNPYTEKTSVQIYVTEKGQLQQRVLDLFGREIYSSRYDLDQGMFSFDPEESTHLAPGIYFVELLFDDERIVTRLVKE